jgi:hypothetical protein
MDRRRVGLVFALLLGACSDIPVNHDTEAKCGCVAEPVRLTPLGSPVDTSATIAPCRTFSLDVAAIGEVPARTCTMPMTCPSLLTGVTVAEAVQHPDVQTALHAGIPQYGAGPGTPNGGGALYLVGIGQATFQVGGPCGSEPCTPVPEGVQALLDILIAVNAQEVRRSPCREMLNF